jgi:farnesyl diphosphate synthase
MTSQTHLNGASAPTDKAARRKRFEDVFPVIAEELLGYVRGEGMPQDAVEWFERVSGDGVARLWFGSQFRVGVKRHL